jgi:hypothetical protein
MPEKIKSIPAASRTLEALSDIGYDLNAAIADILDNSITRGKAKNIYIYFVEDKNRKFNIGIFDDGKGMNSKTLEEAMRFGSETNNYEKGDLSKYGMGMKTASMSQAYKLTVISKKENSQLTSFRFDKNHINKINKWEILKYNNSEIKQILSKLSTITFSNEKEIVGKLIENKSWTIVVWNDLKEFQNNYDSYESNVRAQNYYYKTIDFLSLYLRLVFNRFLSGENNAKKTKIFLNNVKLDALDPFSRKEEHTLEKPLSEKNGNFEIEKNLKPIVIKRFILPTNPSKLGSFKFSSFESWDESKGTLSWNEAQGYYVYRNNRLINWGGWFKTKALDEHDKLARASIDLTEEHDKLFKIDIKKTKIQFPERLRNHLKDNVNKGFISEAKKRYAVEDKKNIAISNSLREKTRKVSHLSSELVQADNISVTEFNNKGNLLIKNKYGTRLSEDLTYKMLEAGKKIISKSFGDDTLLWKMVPSPLNEFQVIINTDHPLYDKVYGDSENDKKVTAILDAFFFTMSFIELKCITTNNEMLFDQMKEVASFVLKKFVNEKII